MPGQKPKLPPNDAAIWRDWLEKRGLSYAAIAAEYLETTGIKVSATAVGNRVRESGLKPAHKATQPGNFSEHIPWSVDWPDRDHELLRLLRDLSRLERGATCIAPASARELKEFLANIREPQGPRLGRGVVVYDRSREPGDRFGIDLWRPGDLKYSRP